MSRSRQQLRDVASCFAALNSYDSEATAIKTATASLLGGKRKGLRTLCSAKWVAGDGKQSGWGVKRRDESGDNRKDVDIRRDLENSVLRRARAYLSQDDALQPSSASGGAAEHASSSAAPKTGPVDADTVLENLQALLQQHAEAIVVRVVDHACSSSACISSRLKAVCQAAGLPSCNLSCTLLADQALDACGYIGADAAVTLRDAALGLGDRWLQAPLRPYHSNACVKRGNNLLGRPGDVNASMLATEDVNTLVHAYANLKQHLQAQEDWWGGAVALDHFATGVGDFLCSAHGSDDARMHQWRTWVVNTQTSTQDGSHWFTVAIGLRGLRESLSAQVSHNAASGHEGGDPGGSACAGPPGTAKSKVQSGATRTHRNDIEECAGAAEHAPHGAATPAVHAAPQAKRSRTILDALGAFFGLGEAASKRLAGNPAARAQRGAAEHSASSSAAAGCRQALVAEERPLLASADATGQARADAASIATPVPARKKPRTEGTVVPASAASSASCDASVASADAPLSTMRDAERTDGDLPYPKLFPKQSDVVTETLRWIQANRKEEKAANFYVEFERWERGLEDGTLLNRNRRQQLCMDCQVVLKAKQRGMDFDGILGVVRAQYLTKLSALRMRASLSDQSWHSVTQLPCNRYQVSHEVILECPSIEFSTQLKAS